MGFRGEALPSIASVSRLTLTTRRADDLAATRVMFEGPRRVDVGEAGAPAGTTVEVADLLWNLPARLKFLKGEATEAGHVTELVGRLALAHPQVHFKLKHNGRTALDTPPDHDAFARVQAVLGAKVTQRMVEVRGEEGGVSVVAYLGAPELAQTTARGVQLFAGPRAIRDRGLLHALAMGYGELVPRGRYPIAMIVVTAPPGAIDINVHPQKLEVRFADPQAVYAAVRHVVARGVASAAWRSDGAGPIHLTAIAGVAAPMVSRGSPAAPLGQQYAAQLRASTQAQLGLGEESPRGWVARVKESVRARRAEEGAPVSWARGTAAERAPQDVEAPSGTFFSQLRFLGQLDLTYLVCEAEGELVLVDQHAAHERVELARLEARHISNDVAVQKLLFPETREVTDDELALVIRSRELLARVGFEAEPFGDRTIALRAVPAGLRHSAPGELLGRLLADWTADGAPSDQERIARVLAEIACHSVVRAGDRLGASEAEALLRSLDDVPVATRNPHGRPVLMRLPLADIARRFGR